MPERTSIWSFLICASAAAGIVYLPTRAAGSPILSGRPSLAEWQQWQPHTDAVDARLYRADNSVAEPEITLGDLLAELSARSGVELTAINDLQGVRLTVFADSRTLLGLMASLEGLVYGYWVFPRSAAADERRYHLVHHGQPIRDFDSWDAQRVAELKLARAARHRAEREERLARCLGALALEVISEVLRE
jgi:hypothetical protein